MTAAHDYARAAAAAVAYPDTRQLTVYRGGYQPSDYKPPAPRIDDVYDAIRGRAWTEHAACRGMDVSLFYPERGDDTEPAKQACASCPVADECGTYALERGERFGIWGGQSERNRRSIRARQSGAVRRQVAQCGTPAGFDRHRNLHEAPCDACRSAHNDYMRVYQAIRRERKRETA